MEINFGGVIHLNVYIQIQDFKIYMGIIDYHDL